jgi:hypothetical protein
MATTLQERVVALEKQVENIEKQLSVPSNMSTTAKKGWRAFVGADTDNPDFAEAVQLGREWRFADSPKDTAEVSESA